MTQAVNNKLDLPNYWLERPQMDLDDATRMAFNALLSATPDPANCPTIQYDLSAPKWQFLCHVAEQFNLALHGSGNPGISRFEPRQSNDLSAFGNQNAIYAAADGIWAMFFAIVDRDTFGMSITNSCVRLVDASGVTHGPYYQFSVSRSVLPQQPWRTGTVYLLPRTTFVSQQPFPFGSNQVHIAQLASLSPVLPLAKLTVTPADFPFLAKIRGHEDHRLAEYAAAIQTAAPWPADTV